MGASASTENGREKFHRCWRLSRTISEGSFGQVRVAWHRSSAETPARCVRISESEAAAAQLGGPRGGWAEQPGASARRRRLVPDEEAIWRKVGQHENCLELLEAFLDEQGHIGYAVTERYKLLTLAGVQAGTQRALREMLQALDHVHALGIVHRDIWPEAFVRGGEDGSTVKLGSYGQAALLPESGSLSGLYGQPEYMSPEMQAQAGYREKTDLWSLGVLAHVALCGSLPGPAFERRGSPKSRLTTCWARGRRPNMEVAKYVDPWGRPLRAEAASFIDNLLQLSPKVRCSAKEALQNDFLVEAFEAEPFAAAEWSSPTGSSLSMKQFLKLYAEGQSPSSASPSPSSFGADAQWLSTSGSTSASSNEE